MQKEADLFDEFTELTKPSKEICLPDKIAKILAAWERKELVTDTDILPLLIEFQDDMSGLEPPSDSDIQAHISSDSINIPKAIELLRKIGRVQVLDITQEIPLLREIKDIQDELNIMSMVFEDQRETITDMERIICAIGKIEDKSQAGAQNEEGSLGPMLEKNDATSRIATRSTQTEESDDTKQEKGGIGKEKRKAQGEPSEAIESGKRTFDKPNLVVGGQNNIKVKAAQPTSNVWKTSKESGPNSSSLALLTVQLSVNEVEGMTQRAAKAYRAVGYFQISGTN